MDDDNFELPKPETEDEMRRRMQQFKGAVLPRRHWDDDKEEQS